MEKKINNNCKYIKFIKRGTWRCMDKKDHHGMGEIVWNKDWKKYCFEPEEYELLSIEDMGDIIKFINKLTIERGEQNER